MAIRLIGLDPGLRRTGWGVIEVEGNSLVHVASGAVTSTTSTQHSRYSVPPVISFSYEKKSQSVRAAHSAWHASADVMVVSNTCSPLNQPGKLKVLSFTAMATTGA